MSDIYTRTSYIIGDDGINRLRNSSVIIFGLGGVGSYCAEALVRAGVGHLCYVDADVVSESNINRQLIALHSTIGMKKVEVAANRASDISNDVEITVKDTFYLPENADSIDLSKFDLIIDAIDTVSAKIELAVRAEKIGVPIISCMGTGNRLHPEMLCLGDIYQTEICHLARVIRSELRKRSVKSLRVVYSKETPVEVSGKVRKDEIPEGKHSVPGSISFVPSSAGLLMASDAVRILLSNKK